tara:strand:+ start:854 stop:1873 length:1020 start_codon:yes stop_codon:yes gene_type:complete
MPFQKVEFEFPDEKEESTEIEIESSSAETLGAEKEEVSDEVELEIVDDDIPAKDKDETGQLRKPGKPPEDLTDDELDEYSDKVQKRIKSLSRGYHDERRAKEAAFRERQEYERLAQQLVEENKQLKGTVSKNQEALLEQAKRTANGEMILAKRAYKQAYDAGDGEALAEAQEKLTAAKIKADRLANLRPNALQEQETPVKTEPDTENYVPAQEPPPIVDDRANDWARNNSWFGENKTMTGYVLGLHQELVEEGVDPQSDEYYETIDSRMRQVFPDRFEDTEEEVVTTKKAANVVAPATRSTAPKKIRLTQTQVAIAKRLGLTPQQYAEQVAKDMRKANG